RLFYPMAYAVGYAQFGALLFALMVIPGLAAAAGGDQGRSRCDGALRINVADVADLIRTGIGGEAVSQVFIGERRYDVTVRFPAEARNSAEAIGNLLLTSSTGALIP